MLLAQQRTVKGVVVSKADNEPVIGASVVVKGSPTIGGATDISGHFNFKVPAGAKTLVVSYVGFVSQEVAIKDGDMKIVLAQDSRQLEDVMVVAYGTATKNSFTGSASTVSVDLLKNKSNANLTTALEGITPGVQVFTESGQPGKDAKIQIRGIGSVNSYTNPLYVVDGIPYGMSMSGIDPADVESMSVLKDASATALYGSRAANGVVLITTRKGKAGKVVVEAEGRYGLNMRLIPLYETISSPEEYAELSYQALSNQYHRFGLKQNLEAEWKDAGLTTPIPTPGELLFNTDYGIPERYNLWDAPSKDLINAQTGTFNPSVKRRYTPESWEDEIFRTGRRFDGNVKISGGADRITYFASMGYQKNVGYYIGSDFARLNIRSNVASQISDNLKATVGFSYSRTEMNSPGQKTNANNGFTFVNQVPAIYPVFEHHEKTNDRVLDPKIPGGYSYDYGQYDGYSRPYSAGINPAGAVRLDRFNDKNNLISTNLNLEYRFLNDFKLAINYGLQYQAGLRGEHTNPYYGDSAGLGRLEKRSRHYRDETFNQILSWGRKFGEHSLDAFVAHESTENEDEQQFTNAKGTVVAGSLDIASYVISERGDSYRLGYAIESYFGQLRYDYAGKYFLSASVRRDGSSRFAPGKRWGTFGSIGAAWLLSQERFMADLSWVNNLKLKASYGILGNQNLDLQYILDTPDYYLYYDLYKLSNLNDKPTFSFYAKGNREISWEKSAVLNFGVEAKLWDRLTLDAELFVKRTTDMMFRKQMAPSVGYAYLPGNEGVLLNQGVEFNLAYEAIKTKHVRLNLNLNGGFYRNEIKEMAWDNATNAPKHYELQNIYAYKKGHSVQDFYIPTYVGVSDTGLPVWESYYYMDTKTVKKDVGGTMVDQVVEVKVPVLDYEEWISTPGNDPSRLQKGETSDYNHATRTFVGKSAIPDLVGGFGFDLTVHGVTLAAAFSYGLGGYGYDYVYASLMDGGASLGKQNYHVDMRNAWREDNKNTDIPIMGSSATPLSRVSSQSTRFLTSRSYLNLANLRLSYALPSSWMSRAGVSSASVYLSGDNLFLLSARSGFVSMSAPKGESEISRYLPVSTITAGVQLRF